MSAKKIIARVFSLAMAVVMVCAIALMTSCNKKIIYDNVLIPLPLEHNEVITYWTIFDPTYMGSFESWADHPFFKDLEKKTNITIEFETPTTDKLGIGDSLHEWEARIAADDTTDMVSHNWFVPQTIGPSIDSFEEEGLYYELTKYVDVQMDNFNALRQQYVNIDKLMYTPLQNIMYIPKLTGVEDLNKTAPVTEGLIIRKDFLDQLQLPVPVTVNDWYNTLTAFKTQLGVEYPFWLGDMGLAPGCIGDAFVSCYGGAYEWYIDKESGKLHYGVTEEGTRKYVTMMNQWYTEGLVAAGSGMNITRADKMGDEVGAWGGPISDLVGLKKGIDGISNPNYELIACPYPVVNEGDKIETRSSYMPIGNREINCIYVCQSYESPALACKWIDQLFSEEAYNLSSYGIEGTDYNKDAEGNITFTDSIMKDEENGTYLYNVSQKLYLGNMWCDRDVLYKYVYDDTIKAAVTTWSNATSERNIIRRTSLQFTEDDQKALAELQDPWMAQTGTIRGMILDTTGESLANWDAFVAQLNENGLTEFVALHQAAWDLYLAG